jgi:bifunctional enzyme CysN/CysC
MFAAEADADGPSAGSLSISPGRGHLRVVTCGSVDDGKSTLVGRLLYDARLVLEDHEQALIRDSHRYGSSGNDLDFALLLDGLEAEREQGITIDVAWRFFATSRRAFILSDSPGHEQYTRNMATAASTADVAVLLVDARKGLLAQTKRHTVICSLLGVRHIILAINKIDLVSYAKDVVDSIVGDYAKFAAQFMFRSLTAVPVSAKFGDNVVNSSSNTPWYSGPTLLRHLELIDVDSDLAAQPFRFSVQLVNRANADFRGYSGVVASGRVCKGDAVVVLPTMVESRVARIIAVDGDRHETTAGDAVTLTLSQEVDASRGDLIAAPAIPAQVSDQFTAHLLWMGNEPLLPGRLYHMRVGDKWTTASVTALKYKINVNTLDHIAVQQLALNEIAVCNIAAATPVPFDPYIENRATGAFVLVDRLSNDTMAAGMIDFGLRRATNLRWENLAVNKAARAAQKQQRPCNLWFTGLSGAGKSTIARLVESKLHAEGRHTYMLDGDNVRHGLNHDLGFADADRVENIRRIGEVAKLMVDAGLIVLCALISPFRAERQMVRELVQEDEFFEIFVDAPLHLCMERDPKGLYAKARAGLVRNFTGFDSPYDRPESPDLYLDTASYSAEELADRVLAQVSKR